ncbi:MAG: hypothetical protein IPP72_03260 [Chitinophagaceae bacterium]|nr:hypothetical protein [Chitinophagaceae bacterium]
MNKLINTSNRFLMTPLISLSIWILAILMSAVVDVVFISLFSHGEAWEAFGLIIVISAMFSLPGIIIFWLVFLLNCKKDGLFNLLFLTALATSFLSAFVFFIAINENFSGQGFWLLLFAVLSALGAVALHRPAINHVLQTQKINNDV